MLRLSRPFAVFALTALAAATAGSALHAQTPKAGDYYVDDADIGFKVKVPKGWEFIPPAPDEGNMIGKYEPTGSKYITLKGSEVLFITCWLLKFDRRKESQVEIPEGGSRDDVIKAASKKVSENLEAWMKRNTRDLGKSFRKIEEDETRINKVDAIEYLYEGKSPGSSGAPGGLPIHCYAMLYKVHPEVDVALVFNTPADKKKWAKWKKPTKSMFKSFKPVEVENAIAAAGAGVRDQKRAKLQKEVATNPGWELYETPNYFVISNSEDRDFIDEAMDRLEAIRKQYEKDYPVEKALEAREMAKKRAEERRKKLMEELGDEFDPEDWEDELRTVSAKADPMEMSKTSVVRICAKREQYIAYGAPQSSAGYWSWVDEELVFYDDKAMGRNETWDTLNHEAFHQYIYYFYGNISPHSWYNEGTGDFYGAHKLKGKRFKVDTNLGRLRAIQQAIREDKHVPLNEIVKWSQSQYYGSNEYGAGGGQNYAQGWSLIYFLRTGKKARARGWDKAWDGILETYLDTMVETGDKEKAVEVAFAGVDWNAFEEAWKSYTMK